MGNPVSQVGTDLIEAGRKLGHAVAAGATEVERVLVGKPGPPVPAPPQFDWADIYKGAAESWADQQAHDYKARQAAEKTQQEYNEGALEDQGLKLQLDRLNVEKISRQSDIVNELRGLDFSKPESAARRKELFEEYSLLSGKAFAGGRPNFATGRVLEAATLAGIDVSQPMSEWSAEDFNEKLPQGYRMLEDKEHTSSSTSTDQYGNKSTTSRTESTHLGGGSKANAVPAPPKFSGGRSGVPAPPKISVSGKPEQGEEEYKMLANGGKITPKAVEVANRYAVRHNLPAPVSITPADKKSLAGLGNLEATFPDLRRYSSVLSSTKSRLKLQEIINQVSKQTGTGIFSSIEGLVGAGVNAALVSSLTPDERKFLESYNQAREAVQTMRQFAGVSRSTQALYNAMAALIPNPYQTRDATMANEQLKRLQNQIDVARKGLGVGAPGASVAAPQTADPRGFVPDSQ